MTILSCARAEATSVRTRSSGFSRRRPPVELPASIHWSPITTSTTSQAAMASLMIFP
jgi:hypothetical protein